GDVRARLNIISEIPGEWEAAVRRWAEHNDRHRPHGYPDRNLEYLAYQTIVGAWPIDEQRLTQFLNKAAREAKLHTSWTNPVAAYEDALAEFVHSVTSDAEFMSDLESFLGRTQLVSRDSAPLNATGAKANHGLGFVRGSLLALVPRLPAGLAGDWGDTEVMLPDGRWTNLLTGEVEDGGRPVAASRLLEKFPVAVLATGIG